MRRFLAFWVVSAITLVWASEPTSLPASSEGAPVFVRIAAGRFHTCGLTTSGGVKCWGYNNLGELGNGTTVGSPTPVEVFGLSTGVDTIAAGFDHTCALTISGGVKCWGDNFHGQLGYGTGSYALSPVNVAGLTSGVTAIAAGGDHACARTTGGAVKCWGRNAEGQLGDGTTTNRSTPVDVLGLTSGIATVDAGGYHTCALTTSGAVQCWGNNNPNGQLGDGTINSSTTPVDVSGLPNPASAIALGGRHTCASTSGGAKCWGFNFFGQLGDGTTSSSPTPVDVSGLTSGVSSIVLGFDYTCALTTGGGAKCWGANDAGQLGNGTLSNSSAPVDVSGLSTGVSAIATGGRHACVITLGGDVKCWGYNANGQLGDGTTTDRRTPVDIVIDTDSDGCADIHELQNATGSETYGGRRNPKYFWDFYDVWTRPDPVGQPNLWVRDRVVTATGDILAVAQRFGATRPGGPPTKQEALVEALTPPTSDMGYHTDYDRGPLVGPNIWNSGPPDGAITVVVDVLQVARSFGHSCL